MAAAFDSGAFYSLAFETPGGSSDVTLGLNGASITTFAGTVTSSQQLSRALSGQAVVISAGSVGFNQTLNRLLTGQSITVSAGSVGTSRTLTLSGSQVTAQSEILQARLTLSLVGQSSTSAAGTLSPSQVISGITLPLNGASVPIQAGSLVSGQSLNRSLTGSSSSSGVGNLTTSQTLSRTLNGAQSSIQSGSVTANQSLNRSLSGSSVNSSTGSVSTTRTLPLTGQPVSIQTDTLTPVVTNDSEIQLNGSSATFVSGSVILAIPCGYYEEGLVDPGYFECQSPYPLTESSVQKLSEIHARLSLTGGLPVTITPDQLTVGTILQTLSISGSTRTGASLPLSTVPLDLLITELWMRLGLDPNNPLEQTDTTISSGDITITLSGTGTIISTRT